MVTPLLVVALCAVGALLSAWALLRWVNRKERQDMTGWCPTYDAIDHGEDA